MRPVEDVLPFVDHPDPLVADLALRHLEAVRFPRPLDGDFILRAAREAPRPELLHWLDRFVVTGDVLAYALAELEARQRAQPTRGEDNGNDKDLFWARGVLVRAPGHLFTDDVARRVEQLHLDKGWVRDSIRVRLETRAWTTEQLQDRLARVTAESDRAGHAMSEQQEAATIVARLAERTDVRAWAWERFTRAGEEEGWWLEIWLASLLIKLGDRRMLDAAVERFLDTGFDKNESLAEEFANAMAELSEPQDVPRLEALFARAEDEHRHRLIGATGRMRFAEAEPLLLRAAREAEARGDAEELTSAAVALCEALATGDEALALVGRVADAEAFDICMSDLEESAIALGVIVGKPFAQADAWRARLESPQRSRARRREWQERFPELVKVTDLIERLEREGALRAAAAARPGTELDDDPLPDIGARPELSIAPFVRGAPRVGRNDPCPCGSGKKYKKCCLHKAKESDAHA